MIDHEEMALPESLRALASISSGGEYGWRRRHILEVIAAAKEAGLACIGGQVQFQVLGATGEAYWLNYDSELHEPGESWPDRVARTCSEVVNGLEAIWSSVDLNEEALGWPFVREWATENNADPEEVTWYILYFEKEP